MTRPARPVTPRSAWQRPEEGLAALGARAIAHGVRTRAFTAESVARAFLDRIAAQESAVGAWHYLDPERTLAEARAVDAAAAPGPLAGVPIGVKDVIDTADMPTGYGSPAYEGSRPSADAPCVALTRGAGAVAFGKTVSTEFAMSTPGKTRNPWNLAHTPGGSSSGSAAAVATGMVPLAFGTQTAGSVIRPAAFCGVVGYKPTFNLFARNGIKMLADGLDTLGVMGRSVDDVALLSSVLASRPELDVIAPVTPPRLGRFSTSRWDQLDPAGAAALHHAAEIAESRGVEVVEIAVPDWFDALFEAQDTLMSWEVTRTLAYERLSLADRISPHCRRSLEDRAKTTLSAYEEADRLGVAARAAFASLFARCDILLTPPARGEAPEGLASTGDPIFNRPWTLLHAPCLTIPVGFGPQGLPLGVQLVGRIGDDAGVLAAGAFLEKALAADPPLNLARAAPAEHAFVNPQRLE